MEAYHFSEKFSFDLKVFPSTDGRTSPNQILENLIERISNISLSGYDQKVDSLWIICDVDSWEKNNIETTINNCNELNIKALFSNPCSEIWILFHQENIDKVPVFESSADCKQAANALMLTRKNYKNLLTEQQINYAITHAKKRQPYLTEKWPEKQGSHIYKLLEFLISSDPSE